MVREYTITVFTENKTGMLSRVVSVFTRRHINIQSLTTSQSSRPDIYRFTIVVNISEGDVQKLVTQIEKQVDVIKAFHYDIDEIVYQEIALYKVPTHVFSNSNRVEMLIRQHNARVLEIEPEYIVIEKTGHQHETEAFLMELEKLGGVFEFVRSGRVAIVRPMERLNTYLNSIEMEMDKKD